MQTTSNSDTAVIKGADHFDYFIRVYQSMVCITKLNGPVKSGLALPAPPSEPPLLPRLWRLNHHN